MSKQIAVITVHGMGDTNPNYFKELEKKLRKYVGKELWDDKVHLESVFYQDLLQGNQEDYWNEIDDEYTLRWDFLRKFMLFSFADAASIEHSMRNDLQLYKAVHGKIATAFDNAYEALGKESKPVIVISHSLGCEQVSNYLWDAGVQKRFFENDSRTDEKSTFRRFGSCEKLFTTGCNIPLFRAGLDTPKLFARPNDKFEWENYFDVHDVLAYPIKNIAEDFNVDWITDHKVGVGGIFNSWNPACHSQYWTDKDVLSPISNCIKSFV